MRWTFTKFTKIPSPAIADAVRERKVNKAICAVNNSAEQVDLAATSEIIEKFKKLL